MTYGENVIDQPGSSNMINWTFNFPTFEASGTFPSRLFIHGHISTYSYTLQGFLAFANGILPGIERNVNHEATYYYPPAGNNDFEVNSYYNFRERLTLGNVVMYERTWRGVAKITPVANNRLKAVLTFTEI